MPPKGKKKQQKSRRRRTRRTKNPENYGGVQPQRGSGSTSNVVLALPRLPLFPQRTRRMLRYEESVALTGSSGAVASYVFTANGLFKPNITGTGHQPMGFDQMMIFFEHYTVLRSRIRLEVFNTTSGIPIKVGIQLGATQTDVSTNYQANIENGRMVYATLTPQNTAMSHAVLNLNANIAQTVGTRNVIDRSDLRGSASANPTEMTFFIITIWNPSVAGAPTCYFDAIIEYDAVFTESIQEIQSLQQNIQLFAERSSSQTSPTRPELKQDDAKQIKVAPRGFPFY